MGIVVCYEDGMTMMEIAKRNHVSERTIYRYKAYYDQLQKDKTEDISRLEKEIVERQGS